jgi:glycosyltransferase involved in cell wall biosynthesis
MRILIVEPYASGHHASYLRWLAQAADARQWSSVVATTHAALLHPSLSTLTSDFHHVRMHVMADLPVEDVRAVRADRLLRREFLYWRAFKRVTADVRRKMRIDAVVLPYLDYFFYALAIMGSPFGDLPWCAISMRLDVRQDLAPPGGAKPGEAGDGLPMSWKWRLAKRVLKGRALRMLFVINPSVQDVPPSWLSAGSRSKLRYLADPAEFEPAGTRAESRSALGILEGQVAILVIGSIEERKGLDSLLNMLRQESGLDRCVVILAGKQSPNIREQVRAAPCAELASQKRLIVIDRFLTDSERNLVLTAADVVWLGYRNHVYMSGVIVLAGRAGLPVLGTPEGEIGRLIARYGLGFAARLDQPTEIASALRAMLDVRTRTDMGLRAQAAFAGHTAEQFGVEVLGVFENLQERTST